jgi:phosphoribosyl 1,2-cyclic phosphodiesterase
MLGYGGNTPCVEVSTPGGLVIIDAGTGIKALGEELAERSPVEGHILFSHTHCDHIQGFPFFAPLFSDKNRFSLYGKNGARLQSVLKRQMVKALFPVSWDELSAELTCASLPTGALPVADLSITSDRLHHPNGVMGFRISDGRSSVVYATDVELSEAQTREKLARFAQGADLLIADAQYSPEEYADGKVGWGHGTWRDAAIVAREAEVGRLFLFHHDPNRTDEEVAEFEERAKELFPNSFAAKERLVVDLSALAARPKEERRKHPRARVSGTAILFSDERRTGPVSAKTWDVSPSGVLCLVEQEFALYDKVRVSMRFPVQGEEKQISTTGIVVRFELSPQPAWPPLYQMAIFFNEISAEDVSLVRDFVLHQQARLDGGLNGGGDSQ